MVISCTRNVFVLLSVVNEPDPAVPTESVDDVTKVFSVFVVVRIVEDVVVVAVVGVVDVLILRHHPDVVHSDSQPESRLAIPVKVGRLC